MNSIATSFADLKQTKSGGHHYGIFTDRCKVEISISPFQRALFIQDYRRQEENAKWQLGKKYLPTDAWLIHPRIYQCCQIVPVVQYANKYFKALIKLYSFRARQQSTILLRIY